MCVLLLLQVVLATPAKSVKKRGKLILTTAVVEVIMMTMSLKKKETKQKEKRKMKQKKE